MSDTQFYDLLLVRIVVIAVVLLNPYAPMLVAYGFFLSKNWLVRNNFVIVMLAINLLATRSYNGKIYFLTIFLMGLLLKILLSAVAVMISAYVIPGVRVNGFVTALIVAVVLGLLNAFVKPILTILTIPITILTLGLFLLVINVIIIYIADALVPGFDVSGFFAALLFSIVLAIIGALLDAIF